MSKWVQHKSGVGEKWETHPTIPRVGNAWRVQTQDGETFYLPVSEYLEVLPMDEWKDVTAECIPSEVGGIHHQGCIVVRDPRYRLRKIQLFKEIREEYDFTQTVRVTSEDKQWAFIVERQRA